VSGAGGVSAREIAERFAGWIGWCHHCGTLQPFAAAHLRRYERRYAWPASWRCATTEGFGVGCGEPWGLGVWPRIAPEFVTPEIERVAAELPEIWGDFSPEVAAAMLLSESVAQPSIW
jgi:hypothetical protein